jgi:hypothetical protein
VLSVFNYDVAGFSVEYFTCTCEYGKEPSGSIKCGEFLG